MFEMFTSKIIVVFSRITFFYINAETIHSLYLRKPCQRSICTIARTKKCTLPGAFVIPLSTRASVLEFM